MPMKKMTSTAVPLHACDDDDGIAPESSSEQEINELVSAACTKWLWSQLQFAEENPDILKALTWRDHYVAAAIKLYMGRQLFEECVKRKFIKDTASALLLAWYKKTGEGTRNATTIRKKRWYANKARMMSFAAVAADDLD